MKVLVTGANGFVGNHLCNDLAARGLSVRAAVRPASRSSFTAAASEVLSAPDLGREAAWSAALKDIDVIIHAAAKVPESRRQSGVSEKEFFKVNCEGTLNLARQAATAGVKRFIFISTSLVLGRYQSKDAEPLDETAQPAPTCPYSRSKAKAETKLMSLVDNGRFDVVIMRPPVVYGPGTRAGIYQLLKLHRSGMPLPLARAQAPRSFLYIGNLTDAVARIVMNDIEHDGLVHVSDNDDRSIYQLIVALDAASDRRSMVFPVPRVIMKAGLNLLGKAQLYDVVFRPFRLYPEKLLRAGWTPPWTISEAVQRTFVWFEENNT